MVAMTDVLSCFAWSTTNLPFSPGAIVSAGMRVLGPQASCAPELPP